MCQLAVDAGMKAGPYANMDDNCLVGAVGEGALTPSSMLTFSFHTLTNNEQVKRFKDNPKWARLEPGVKYSVAKWLPAVKCPQWTSEAQVRVTDCSSP